jgi:hypothetical protein
MRTRPPKKGPAAKRPAAPQEAERTLCAEPIKRWPAKERRRERLLADGPARLPPLTVQKEIVERIAAQRQEIAREREAANHLARDIDAEIEALILGSKGLN